jgi:hypothetical protein
LQPSDYQPDQQREQLPAPIRTEPSRAPSIPSVPREKPTIIYDYDEDEAILKSLQASLPTRRSARSRTVPDRLGFESQSKGYYAHFAKYYHLASHNVLLAKKTFYPDTLSYQDVMRAPDRDEWMKAAQSEIQSLEKHGTWKEVPRSEATSNILPGTWTFRRKRTPDGEVKKLKGRYCVRGDLEEDTQDNYSPVVSWTAVRLFLTLSLIFGWEMISIDFSSAFVQAYLKKPTWIHLPRGYISSKGSSTCLRLVKSLYGLGAAPALWFEKISQAFVSLGFCQSVYDSCLF